MIARLALTVVLVTALMVAIAHPASGALLLSDGDAAELAQSLADATEEQDVCYGWQVQVQDGSGGASGLDLGSNLGPGRPVGAAATGCDRTVILEALVRYTCDSCESEDSASVRVVANFAGGPTAQDLRDLGLEGGDLAKDTGDVVLANMVGALPLIVTSKGAAAPVPVQPSTITPSATDAPTNRPSVPDWLRDSWLALSALLVVVAGSALWLVKLVGDERSRRPVTRGITTSRGARDTAADRPTDTGADHHG